MAHGGFHGGGFHSGGHHSGGGFGGGGFGGGFHSSGGGFGGGGFHGSFGGYHGGSGGGGHYGHYGYYGGDDEYGNHVVGAMVYMTIGGIVFSVMLFSFVAGLIYEGVIPGLNFINLAIFVASVVMHIVALIQSGRTADIRNIEYVDLNKFAGKIWNGNGYRPRNAKGDKRTWASVNDKRYSISFFDREFGAENAKKVLETKLRTPKILWVKPSLWLKLSIGCFIVNFFFYEAVIPVFENMIMTDIAFAFIDEFVFYLMSVLSLLFAVAAVVIFIAKDNVLHECALRIVEDNVAFEERYKTESAISSMLSEKWYHNSCPNCGAPASKVLKNCLSCGSSLEVLSFETGAPGAVHRLSLADEKGKEAKKEKTK